MKRFFTEMNATLRGFLIIALIAGVVVVLSLQSVLATVGGLLRIAFFLAIAFFLFLLWREKRGDIESWQDRSRNVFYAAIVLAVVDVGAFIGLRPSGRDALAFFLVLGACAYAAFRIWRTEHTYLRFGRRSRPFRVFARSASARRMPILRSQSSADLLEQPVDVRDHRNGGVGERGGFVLPGRVAAEDVVDVVDEAGGAELAEIGAGEVRPRDPLGVPVLRHAWVVED